MAISKSLQAVLDRQGSLSDAQQVEVAKHNFENPDNPLFGGSTTFTDPTIGFQDYRDINKAGSAVYQMFNPVSQQNTATALSQAQDFYRQQTGAELRGESLDVVKGHITGGNTFMDALKNLGDLQANERNRTASGEAIVSAGKVNESGFALAPGGSIEETAAQQMARTGQTQLDIDIERGTSTLGDINAKAQQFANQLPLPQTPTVGQLEAAQNLDTGILPQDGGSVDGFVAQAGQFAKDIDLGEELLPEQEQEQTLLDELAGLTGEATQRGADQAKAELEAGQAEKRANLQRIKGKMIAKQLEFEAFKLQQEGKPMTMARFVGSIAQKRSTIASEITMLQAEALIAQGELADAQASIDRAIDLKYATIDAQYQIKQAQLAALMPSLNRAEQKQALALQRQYETQQQAIAEQKASDKQIQSIMLQAASGGASSEILSSISNATSVTEASQAYSGFVRSTQISSPTPSNIPQPVSTEPTQTFEQFVSEREEELGQSIADREGLRTEYEQQVSLEQAIPLSDLTQAIVDNPLLFDTVTNTEHKEIIKELQANGYDTSNLGVKGLSDTAIKKIAETQSGLDQISGLRTSIEKNKEFVGPITGLARFNPWSKAKQLQADIDRVRQAVGKALEGGVLRKEDEEKYKRILPTMNDTAETVVHKMNQLVSVMQEDIENYKSLQQTAGRSLDVGAPLQKKGTEVSSGSTSGGNTYSVTKE